MTETVVAFQPILKEATLSNAQISHASMSGRLEEVLRTGLLTDSETYFRPVSAKSFPGRRCNIPPRMSLITVKAIQ